MRRPSALVVATIALGFVVLAGVANPAGRSATPSRDSKLRDTLTALVSRASSPGGVLLVQTPSGTWRGAVGLAQIKPRKKMTVSARFRVASVTKTFTAALVLRLVADGIVSLDDRLEQSLPGRLPNGAGAAITVRHLLGHTSGVIDDGPEWVGGPPGAYHYANRNYVLLGEIVEAVTGSTFEGQLSDRILFPLGLGRTEYSTEAGIPPGLAHGYTRGPPRLDVTTIPFTTPAAALVSTAADLAVFERALFRGRVVSQSLVATMQNPGTVQGYQTAGYDAYGLGLMRFPSRCGAAWGHRGRHDGYTSWLLSTADGKRTAVALLNVGHTLADNARVRMLTRIVTTAFCL